MIFCENCKKEESEWETGSKYPLMFVYHIKEDDKEHYICPKCVYKRLKQLADNEKGEQNE